MNKYANALIFLLLALLGCNIKKDVTDISDNEKNDIQISIQKEIDEGVKATKTKDIDLYMSQIPEDFVIYDESGEIITRNKQKEYALRDWSIIDTTLSILITIDSIQFLKRDSLIVYTSQEWKRMMFRRDGITKDTVLTKQKHREVWKKSPNGWFGYEVKELGGLVFINGKAYKPE